MNRIVVGIDCKGKRCYFCRFRKMYHNEYYYCDLYCRDGIPANSRLQYDDEIGGLRRLDECHAADVSSLLIGVDL